MKLAFSDSAVPEEAGRHAVASPHAIGECEPNRQRQTAAHDGVAAMEICRTIEQMHGAATPAAAALLLSVHLRKHRGHRHPAHQRLPMLAVGGHDPITLLEYRYDADGNRFLAVIEVQKPPDLL